MAAAPEFVSAPRRLALIVDDSSLACAVLSRLLEQEGFDSELAGSGAAALERVRVRRPDVIFMDHLMPGMTGFEAVRALKSEARTAAIPVVMFSSQEDEAFLTAAREAGALAVLTKHTERTQLGPLLARIGVTPPAPVIPVPVAAPLPTVAPPAVGLTRADLCVAIEPLLREQRDRIREELLAELAILENHQEGTQRALLGRLEAVLRRTLRERGEELSARLSPAVGRSLLARVARGGLVAAALALLAVPIGLLAEQGQRLERVIAGSADLHAAADTQSRSVAALGQQLGDLGLQVAATATRLQWVADASLRPPAAPLATAIEPAPEQLPLAELLSVSGIDGPIELRSNQGRFCLELDSSGYRLLPMGRGAGCLAGKTLALMASVSPAQQVDRAY